ncbi:MAG TPA: hypothetical protein VMB02_07505 [Candidatus Aquilonibacter sp.]|nr:hypothetical protein [Candidatus Aquilonibacter sp.]
MERIDTAKKTVERRESAAIEWDAPSLPHREARIENRVSVAVFFLEFAKQCWSGLHLLSLDAPLVAILWQLLFAKALHVHLSPVVPVVLGSVIWLIYVADRILDSYQPGDVAPEALRHQFYRRYRVAFVPAFLAVLLATSWMAFADLGLQMRRDGILLAAVVGGYLAVVHLAGSRACQWFPKEMAVAILFAAGTLMPVRIQVQLRVRFLLPLLLFLAVLWMNTLFIEYSEWVKLRGSSLDRPHESTVLLGRHLMAFGATIGILALCAMASQWFPLSRPILLAEGLSAIALGVLGWRWRRISPYTVRVSADLALLTPLLLLLSQR